METTHISIYQQMDNQNQEYPYDVLLFSCKKAVCQLYLKLPWLRVLGAQAAPLDRTREEAQTRPQSPRPLDQAG